MIPGPFPGARTDTGNSAHTDTPTRPRTATALLRAAGLPASSWAAAGNPHLFARATAYHRARQTLAERARTLADLLGTTVVPRLPPHSPHRRAVIALRRRLHSGAAPDAADCRLLALGTGVPAARWRQAHDLYVADNALAEEYDALARATAEEWERVGELCWELARAHPVMRVFLDSTAPELTETVQRRLDRGEHWSSARLRRNSTFLWRALARAAIKTTPRDWVGQIAPLPITPTLDRTLTVPRLLTPGSVLTAMAAEVSHNVHTLRTRLNALDLTTADATTMIAPAPLHFTTPEGNGASKNGAPHGHLHYGVIDPAHPGTLRRIDLVRTPALDAVMARLATGPRPVGEIETELLAGITGERAETARHALRNFLAHLHRLGVLETCAPPHRVHSGWTAPRPRAAPLPHPAPWPGGVTTAVPSDWFLDSYRRAETPGRRPLTVPAEAVDIIHTGLRTAARLTALRRADRADTPDTGTPPDPLPGLDTEPRPLRSFLEPPEHQGQSATRRPCYEGWHPARTPDSGYARLLDHLRDQRDQDGYADSFDIDDALLDAVGAPRAEEAMPPWPLDCLVRPLGGHGPLAVLESASPAAVLDARFADTLDTLITGHDNTAYDNTAYDNTGYDNTAHYRGFLTAVERTADIHFVEVLVPPLAERAANAVRRPRLTSWWTGDPDPAPYYGTTGLTGARYLPLDRITLRREGTRVVAEADGRRIVPVHHATRTPMPPYDHLLRVLLTARHPGTGTVLRCDGLAGAFPGARRVPRLTVGGRLVVGPASHRIADTRLWDPGDTDRDKVIRLAALRDVDRLPRFGFVRVRRDTPQTPVDFDALPALRTIDRLRARYGRDGGLLVEEALPAPGDHLLRDRAHPGDRATVAAQLLLRSPHTLDTLIEAAAAALNA
ncbi:lantibiotic dehydratase [Streptomyces sp. NPDC091292]|uniref:lantibiotic dehydratase n=1 Tax=Streptomyces sp. NPDC091292 TaxID=3365991 RepID=UPI0037FDDA5E